MESLVSELPVLCLEGAIWNSENLLAHITSLTEQSPRCVWSWTDKLQVDRLYFNSWTYRFLCGLSRTDSVRLQGSCKKVPTILYSPIQHARYGSEDRRVFAKQIAAMRRRMRRRRIAGARRAYRALLDSTRQQTTLLVSLRCFTLSERNLPGFIPKKVRSFKWRRHHFLSP